jgi:hypothetical protein
MLISKEKFINYLNKYKEAYEEQQKFQDALRPFFDSPVCKYQDNLMLAYEELLVEVSECEEDGIFSWWLYEGHLDNAIISVTDTTNNKTTTDFEVSTPEGLYNYLVYMYGGN